LDSSKKWEIAFSGKLENPTRGIAKITKHGNVGGIAGHNMEKGLGRSPPQRWQIKAKRDFLLTYRGKPVNIQVKESENGRRSCRESEFCHWCINITCQQGKRILGR